MTIRARRFVPILVTLLLATIGARLANGQITNPIEAHVDHSFIIGNTTLPPGDYTFRMLPDSDRAAMAVTSKNDKVNLDFLVQECLLDHTPRHSELVFRKNGNNEFLSKVFESGSKSGVELTETSRQQACLLIPRASGKRLFWGSSNSEPFFHSPWIANFYFGEFHSVLALLH